MKAMVVNSYGGPDAFEVADVAKPDIQSGQVLVKVAASSVNTVDTMIRELGEALPFSPATPAILGMDFAGTVEAVADDVTDFQVGDEVYGCAGGLGALQGSLAEYMPADQRLIAHKPSNLSMKEAAALPLVAITAYEGLTRANTKAGDKVLVHGGAGGVGHIAIQIAKAMGADVSATIGRDEHVPLMNLLGASVINYKTDKVEDYVAKYTGGAGFDVVFDSVGGENMLKSFEAAKLNGHVASTVTLLSLDLSLVHMKGLSLHVVFMLIQMIHGVRQQEHQDILKEVAKLAESGQLSPVLDDVEFTLEDIGKAHERLSAGKATGKVVVEI
ncbi:zinc-dependent alcohol dehydrogenase family protein [Vibrio sp. SCSIO 43140]|uniref:zinc-dependent alcohol dehydrogenase family protein n=1 Tax=Vibrio sp. SCSIO 43140 TaxID=2819100 RepID=UPI002074DE0D|nr:zinc-dependent alcohol dehydrogenase family protein [Vibrio sp. SCSIO 43140]USD63179.1 zinc-dependent alcohol dehydrogenase family protein [Vibrio sp. SCSIO 43140]